MQGEGNLNMGFLVQTSGIEAQKMSFTLERQTQVSYNPKKAQDKDI